MATWNRGLRTQGVLRGLLLLNAVAVLLWSTSVLPSFWRAAPLRDVVARIMADDKFKPGALSKILLVMKSSPVPVISQPEFRQADALITLRATEETVRRGDREQADGEVQTAESKVRTSLSSNPTDSFLWLMLYSVTTMRHGFDGETAEFLSKSYATGPLEGWIAVRRNSVGLAAFPLLDRRLQDAVVSEYAELVDNSFIGEAEAILIGPGWPQRDRLLYSLLDVDSRPKVALSKALSRDGIKVSIPGLDMPERPW